ncbi:MAG: hypothetical protein QXU71_03760 [Candidatus Aenigmatarchaeota archaeon]
MKKTNLILSIFFTIFLLNVLTFGEDIEKVYVLYIKVFRNNSIELLDFSATYGNPSQLFDLDSNYSIRIISVDNKILFEKPLPIYFIAYMTKEEEGEIAHGEVILESTLLYLKLPYFPNGKWINIYYLDKLIFSIDISEKLCDNDGICEDFETEYICEKDCIKISQYQTKRREEINLTYLLGLIILIVVLLIFFIKIKNIKNKSFGEGNYENKNYDIY